MGYEGGSMGGSVDDSWYRYPIDPEEHPTEAITSAVGAVTNTSISEMDPLCQTIDPDTLGAFHRDERAIRFRVEFIYNGCQVSVTNDAVRVRECEEI